jgi:hypothetical protein
MVKKFAPLSVFLFLFHVLQAQTPIDQKALVGEVVRPPGIKAKHLAKFNFEELRKKTSALINKYNLPLDEKANFNVTTIVIGNQVCRSCPS